MYTYVAESMPLSFWEYANEMGLRSKFILDTKGMENEIDIIIIRTKTRADKSFITRFPQLKLIIRAGTGYDNVDLEAAVGNKVAVATTPEANAQSAYEQTIMFILALIKQVGVAAESLKSGYWKEMIKPNLEISDLKVLIVGLGRIGKRVNRTLQYLGAEVKGVDPYIDKSEWKINNIAEVDYNKGLEWCNLVTYHCPLTSDSYHYFDDEHLQNLKQPIYVVNCARGGIVNESVLKEGIVSGKILGAALDVLEKEPGRAQIFQDFQEVILSPHIGAHTEKAKIRLSKETWKTWYEFYENGQLLNEVDYNFAFLHNFIG